MMTTLGIGLVMVKIFEALLAFLFMAIDREYSKALVAMLAKPVYLAIVYGIGWLALNLRGMG